MLHLITGGSGSGKSAYAEKEAMRLSQTGDTMLDKYYIATMEPFGEETRKKIERHKIMRLGKGFETIECYVDLAETVERSKELCGSVVLLECMSNLTANELYRDDGAKDRTAEEILRGVEQLCEICAHVVIVTNEVFSECGQDSPEMQRYKQVLAGINRALAERADAVTEVVYGIPVEVRR